MLWIRYSPPSYAGAKHQCFQCVLHKGQRRQWREWRRRPGRWRRVEVRAWRGAERSGVQDADAVGFSAGSHRRCRAGMCRSLAVHPFPGVGLDTLAPGAWNPSLVSGCEKHREAICRPNTQPTIKHTYGYDSDAFRTAYIALPEALAVKDRLGLSTSGLPEPGAALLLQGSYQVHQGSHSSRQVSEVGFGGVCQGWLTGDMHSWKRKRGDAPCKPPRGRSNAQITALQVIHLGRARARPIQLCQ